MMSRPEKFKVLMPAVPGQRFSCHSCTNCCRDTIVTLTEADRRRIDALDFLDEIDRPVYVRVGKDWILNKVDDGSCVFLDQDGRCRIHSQAGPRSKPIACQVFPFGVLLGHDGRRRVSLRFDCPSVARSQGQPIAEHTKEVMRLSPQRGRRSRERPGSPEWKRGVTAGQREIETLVNRLDGWFDDARRSWSQRIEGSIRATELLAMASSDVSGGKRFDEHLARVFGPWEDERARDGLSPATSRQRRMLRELVFAHTDHATFGDLRARRMERLARRWRALRAAHTFRRGKVRAPQSRGLPTDVRFANIETVAPATEDADRIAALLTRYVRARLQSHRWFGTGYHGWPVFEGLRGLWASIAVTGWVARWLAAGDDRPVLCFEDVVRAIGIVDLATLQLPPGRRVTTRLRVEYLAGDDGLLRLMLVWPLVPGDK